MKRESGSVRPSVLLICTLVLAGCGFAIYQAFDFDPREDTAQLADDADGVRHSDDRRSDSRSERRHSNRSHASSHHGGGGAYTHHDWDRETELSRALALHLPGPSFWRDAAEHGPPRNDPQMWAMWRSYNDAAAETPPLPFEPTAHRAELIEATGDLASSPTSCDVRVLPVTGGRFNCVVRVMCDGRVLYPNASQTAGYVPCEIEDGRPVRALDDGDTRRDGDPLVDLDLARGTVRVEEYDASGQQTYSATLRIQS